MKNLLTLILAFVFIIGMTACGGAATQEDNTEATETVEGMETSIDATETDSTAVDQDEEIEDDEEGESEGEGESNN